MHSNSGVPNHAYALMVDGGAFNGRTVTGIGLAKAGKIQYRTLTNYLTTGSNFLDNYRSLQQSCTDLIGTAGITAADCVSVKDALDAVEMSQAICAIPGEPELCPAGQTRTDLFFDGLEAGGGNFVLQTAVGSNSWFLGDFFAKTGVLHLLNLPQTPGAHRFQRRHESGRSRSRPGLAFSSATCGNSSAMRDARPRPSVTARSSRSALMAGRAGPMPAA